jgi:hypothetical protein
MRGLTLSGEDARRGCVDKMITYHALGAGMVAGESIVCGGRATRWSPTTVIPEMTSAIIRASPCRLLRVAGRPASEGIQLAGEVTIGNVELIGVLRWGRSRAREKWTLPGGGVRYPSPVIRGGPPSGGEVKSPALKSRRQAERRG